MVRTMTLEWIQGPDENIPPWTGRQAGRQLPRTYSHYTTRVWCTGARGAVHWASQVQTHKRTSVRASQGDAERPVLSGAGLSVQYTPLLNEGSSEP